VTRFFLISPVMGLTLLLSALPLLHAQNLEQTVTGIVKKSSDAVVLIVIADSKGKETSIGSGFLVSSDGKILTNYHVIQGAHSAVAKLSNGAFFGVDTVLAYDKDKDLALLKVSGKGLPFLQLGDSDKLEIGEHVVAIGSPLGLENSVSDGIISGIRESEGKSWIQTTVPVSHGNSGGPLLQTSDGTVIGVIEWQVNPSVSQNLNFAIPINQSKPLVSSSQAPVSFESLQSTDSGEQTPGSKMEPPHRAQTRSVEEVMVSAKTIYVWMRNGSPVLRSEISKKLLKWGRLTVVTSPEQADLVLEVVQTGQLDVATGAGNQATATLKDHQSEVELWSDTKGGSWAMSGWSNAWVGRAIAGDLIKFFDSVSKKKK